MFWIVKGLFLLIPSRSLPLSSVLCYKHLKILTVQILAFEHLLCVYVVLRHYFDYDTVRFF